MMKSKDVYSFVTERIVEQLAKGEIPWKNTRSKPLIRARNLASGKPYRGANFWLLNYGPGHASPFWVTFKQALDQGGNVRKGEHSQLVVFWKLHEGKELDERTGKLKQFPVLRYYNVFNVDQCENVVDPLLDPEPIKDPIGAAQAIIEAMPQKPETVFSSNVKAFYQAATDKVVMPQASGFISREEFYRTYFHELAHSTGHESRLNRWEDGVKVNLGDKDGYGFEELVAELAASYLCAEAGIFEDTCEKHAGYCQHWIKVLEEDEKLFVRASAKAQKAADFILGIKAQSEEGEVK